MGTWARLGIVCLMGLAICVARLIEVELASRRAEPLSLTRPAGARPTAAADPGAASGPRQEPTAAPELPRTYTIQAGDTLQKISKRVYGSSQHWAELQRANPSLDPRRLKLGATILVPDLPDSSQ